MVPFIGSSFIWHVYNHHPCAVDNSVGALISSLMFKCSKCSPKLKILLWRSKDVMSPAYPGYKPKDTRRHSGEIWNVIKQKRCGDVEKKTDSSETKQWRRIEARTDNRYCYDRERDDKICLDPRTPFYFKLQADGPPYFGQLSHLYGSCVI